MQKRVELDRSKAVKSAAFSQIFLLIMATVAFAFLIADTERVSAFEYWQVNPADGSVKQVTLSTLTSSPGLGKTLFPFQDYANAAAVHNAWVAAGSPGAQAATTTNTLGGAGTTYYYSGDAKDPTSQFAYQNGQMYVKNSAGGWELSSRTPQGLTAYSLDNSAAGYLASTFNPDNIQSYAYYNDENGMLYRTSPTGLNQGMREFYDPGIGWESEPGSATGLTEVSQATYLEQKSNIDTSFSDQNYFPAPALTQPGSAGRTPPPSTTPGGTDANGGVDALTKGAPQITSFINGGGNTNAMSYSNADSTVLYQRFGDKVQKFDGKTNSWTDATPEDLKGLKEIDTSQAVNINEAMRTENGYGNLQHASPDAGGGGQTAGTGNYQVSVAPLTPEAFGTRYVTKAITVDTPNNGVVTLEKDTAITGHNDGSVSFTGKDASGKDVDVTITDKTQAQNFLDQTNLKKNIEGYAGYHGITNEFLGNLAEGAVWAVGVAGAIQLIGRLIPGLEVSAVNALTVGAFAGIIVAKGLYGLLGKGTGHAWIAGISGVAVGLLIFYAMYKKETTKTVVFTCLPYEAPKGGNYCGQCNGNPQKPCTEYRCKSLGQACEVVNKGTKNELCVWKDPKDVTSPTITPWVDVLSPDGLKYINDSSIRPPALGVKIQKDGDDKCLAPYSQLKFGINTNEAAQCWIDYQHTNSTKSMQFMFGETSGFDYNHTEILKLPGSDLLANSSSTSPILKNDGTMELFVRCADANGNENVDEYKISFCVDKAPRTAPPYMQGTSVPSGSFVAYNADSTPIELYTDEPAQCKWSTITGESYDNMPFNMSCSGDSREINAQLNYVCTANLTGIKNQADNNYYFKCKDDSGNENTQSFPLVLKGTQPLNIINLGPNDTVYGSSSIVPVNLTVETNAGADSGRAICYYSSSGAVNEFYEMFMTNSSLHEQDGLMLSAGTYKYYIRCRDDGGNLAVNQTTFSVVVDDSAPIVKSVYKDSNGALRIVTNEDGSCKYSLTSCNFVYNDGIDLETDPNAQNNHFIPDWKANTVYYVKCVDLLGNEPNPADCTVKVNVVQLSGTGTSTGTSSA